MTSTVPSGTKPLSIATQALRAWLLSARPSGTKAIRLSKRLTSILALMGISPKAASAQKCPKDRWFDVTKGHVGRAPKGSLKAKSNVQFKEEVLSAF